MRKFLFASLFFISINCISQQKYVRKDSCLNPLFIGLTHSQWDSLDAPYWQKLDSGAVKRAGGIFLGDLPSSMKGYTMGDEKGFTIVYYHPSVDSSHYEKHTWIYVPKPKK